MKLTWRSMREVLTKLTEEEVLKLLQEEQAGWYPRPDNWPERSKT